MAAARAFTARNPGQPLSVVFFNAKPTVALPLTTRSRPGCQGAREAAEARRGDAHVRRARGGGRPGPGLCTRRRAHRAAVRRRRRRQRHARSTPRSSSSRTRTSASTPSASSRRRFMPDDLEKIADETGGEYAVGQPRRTSSRRSTTSSASGSGTSISSATVAGTPGRERRRAHRRRRRRGAGLVLLPEPEHGDGGALHAGVPDELMQSWVLIPLLVRARHRARVPRDPVHLEPPLEQGARRPSR